MSNKSVDNCAEGTSEYNKNIVNEVNITKDLVFDVDKPKSTIGGKDQPLKTDIDFDDLLPHIGNFGNYQIILFLLLAPYTLFYVFVYFTQIFITLVPNDYWCNVPELLHLEASDR